MKGFLFCLSWLVSISVCIAQKKPLDHSVYDGWQHIGERLISNDGRWVVYTIDPQEGDNELVVQSSDAKYKKTIPRGYTALITEDSRFVVFKIKPFYKDTREARIRKKKPDDIPKDSIGIIELGREEVWKAPRTKTYKSPQKTFGWIAYHLEKTPEPPVKRSPDNANKKLTDSLNRIIDSLQNIIRSTQAPSKRNKDGIDESLDYSLLTIDGDAEGDDPAAPATDAGTDLIIRNLLTGEEKTVTNVLEYYFSKTGNKLLIEKAKDSKDSTSKAKVLLYDLDRSAFVVLAEGNTDYKNFTMTDDGGKIAYVAEPESKPKDLQHFYSLWYYDSSLSKAKKLVDKHTAGMQLGMTVSEYGLLSFSKKGKRLFFGVAPLPSPKDTSFVDFDHPKLDIWHYKDDYLQTVQNFPTRLRAAQQQNFLSVFDLDKKTIRQLATEKIPQVLPTNEGDGDQFVGVTDYGKRIESQWNGGTLKDIYAIDVNTGDKQLVKENLQGQVYPSSTGKYIMWYDRKARNYFTWDGANTTNISSSFKVPLWNEESEVPDDPNAYGVMGWQEGDSSVFVYDRYDIWRLHPSNTQVAEGLTRFGRGGHDRIRYLQTDPDTRYFKTGQQIFYRVFNEDTKTDMLVESRLADNGFSFETVESGKVLFAGTVKARNTNTLVYTKETFTESPDIFCQQLTPNNVDIPVKLSSINPQQKEYNWGTAELVHWKAYDGKDATGIVYKPEDFDAKKKYPMIVYFYETLSDGLYDYKEPAPIRSAINVPFFVSRGYIIFFPDIHYTTGHPGKNAYDYIVSGTRALVKKGWVDSANMALQGHSWGGYQAAQVATMTKLYKAIWAGAPVANMTSAYGGIRWESGASRQFQYEKTQSRIGATLWEKPNLYLENSPLFHLDKVTSPMVIMANDADGAVPWYQGIELFSGLRRLGKKVWMFNYNGQGHGLTQKQDMRDYQIRMQQFFDWILKGDKPAVWITEGVPAAKKGKEFGLEID